jgi:Zn-dependent peptidase ImmA (M78 family)/DNA-binding XRE family transcriptional regulator
MFSKNLEYYRLKNSMTKKDLAEKLGITPMAITNYESGKRKPSMELLKKMAELFKINVSDFLNIRNENLVFSHGEFRKNGSLAQYEQDYIKASVEEYFNRFMTIVEILGGEVLPKAPETNILDLFDDIEVNATKLRKHLKLAPEGPIDNLVEILENKGILVYFCDINNEDFSGMNGFVNNLPYIVLNKNMSPERNRSTIAHELAHLMFKWPDSLDDDTIENIATAISGAFLFPKDDAIRELGIKRTVISQDMLLVAKEYGISMFLLVKRANMLNIVTNNVAQDFYIFASKYGWRKNEPSRIKKEIPTLFEQLVYRAINENEISIQKGTELLNLPYNEIASHCCFLEVENATNQ